MSPRPITEDDLHAYVDRALDAERQAEVADYLANHPDVARRVEGYRRQREALRAALAPVAEEPVPPELTLARLVERRRSGGAFWRMAVAAALLLVVGGFGGWSLHGFVRPAPGGVVALAQEAVDSYQTYALDRIRPVELRVADRAALLDWVSQRLNRRIAAPDLATVGYRFMGGRLVATPHGPAVLFMYDDDRGTRLVLLARPMAVDQNAPMSLHSQGAITGYAWADNGLGYSLVGPTSPEILHPIADRVRSQVSGAT